MLLDMIAKLNDSKTQLVILTLVGRTAPPGNELMAQLTPPAACVKRMFLIAIGESVVGAI